MKEHYYTLQHSGEGMFEYDKQKFKEEKAYLQKTLNNLKRNNIMPSVGDMIRGESEVYYIKTICHYIHSTVFWVDEVEFRENEY